jgi:hypothetical protein
MKDIPAGVFKPKPTSGEAKSDTTTKVARQILDGERAAREAKTERLRLARLAKEAAEPVIAPPKPRARPAKRRARG